MLLNLKKEIARKKLSAAKVAELVGMSRYTLSRKITERNSFTRDEMYHIHDTVFPDTDFYELFKSE